MRSAPRRAIAHAVKVVIKADARETCEPVQLGQGTPAGKQCMGNKISYHAKLHPTHVVFKNDTANAFNTTERAEMMLEISKGTSKLRSATRYFESELRPKSKIFSLSGGRLKELYFQSVNGGQQGALSAGVGHNVAVQPH
jgi:hypothetical protein